MQRVVLAQRGDPDALAALLGSRRAPLLRLLVAMIGDWHEAEDALQETLWQACRVASPGCGNPGRSTPGCAGW